MASYTAWWLQLALLYVKKAVKRVDPRSSYHKENILKDCCCCLVAELCPSLCEPKDCCLTGSSVCGISQASVLSEWVAISPPGNLSNSGIKPASPALAGGFLTAEPPGKPVCWLGGCYPACSVGGVPAGRLLAPLLPCSQGSGDRPVNKQLAAACGQWTEVWEQDPCSPSM